MNIAHKFFAFLTGFLRQRGRQNNNFTYSSVKGEEQQETIVGPDEKLQKEELSSDIF